jgi:hypothetical protein
MPAYYSVVQCVPGPVANELMNIGIIDIGDDGARCRFFRNWDRASRLGQENTGCLKVYARKIEALLAEWPAAGASRQKSAGLQRASSHGNVLGKRHSDHSALCLVAAR